MERKWRKLLYIWPKKIKETDTYALQSEYSIWHMERGKYEPRLMNETESDFFTFLVDVAVSEVIIAFAMERGHQGITFYNSILRYNERKWYFYGKMEDGTVFCTRLYPRIEYEYEPHTEEIQEAIKEETEKWKERKVI